MTDHPDDRYARGRAKLAEVAGSTGEDVVSPLGDLGRYVVEFAYGDVWSRDGLEIREREIVTLATLIALGGHERELRAHLRAGLHVGLTPQELEEIVIQTAPYAGFPAAIDAFEVLRAVVESDTR